MWAHEGHYLPERIAGMRSNISENHESADRKGRNKQITFSQVHRFAFEIVARITTENLPSFILQGRFHPRTGNEIPEWE